MRLVRLLALAQASFASGRRLYCLRRHVLAQRPRAFSHPRQACVWWLQVSGAVAQALEQGAALTASQLAEAEQDAELEVNALRNAAYARGMAATRKAVAAHVLGEWR